MATVSFVGLGTMGQAMVRHLLSEGHQVTVWNRSPGVVEELVADGARRADTVAEAFAAGPVFSMLSNDQAVDAVFSADTLTTAAAGGSAVHVNMATISLELAQRLSDRHAQAGVGYVGCPVLGRPPVAASGQLNLLAAGDPALLDRLAPVLDSLGKRTWTFGVEPWRANVAKIVMNFLLVHMLSGLSEGITLAERHGLDTGELVELLTNSFFPGPVYQGYATEIAEQNYLPAAFTTVLGRKDLQLAQDAAAAVDLALPSVPGLVALFDQAIERGYADHDWAAVAEVVRGNTAD